MKCELRTSARQYYSNFTGSGSWFAELCIPGLGLGHGDSTQLDVGCSANRRRASDRPLPSHLYTRSSVLVVTNDHSRNYKW